MKQRGGRLSAADVEIWRAVAETVPRRMPGASLPPRPETPKRGALGPAAPVPREFAAPGWSPPAQKIIAVPAQIEEPLRKRVARGRQAIDGKLDLHGFRQADAHRRLLVFIADAQARGHRIVLVVTGKGKGNAPGGEGGVLRRLVPLWLTEVRMAPLIVGFGEAARGHGGEGALYVHLRGRRRSQA